MRLTLRRPAAHFALLGGMLFALAHAFGGSDADRASIATVPHAALDEEVLYRAAVANGLARDDPVVQGRLLRNMRFLTAAPTDGDALVRDAAQLGLASSDLVVRRRLIERMRMRLEEPARAQEPSEVELQAYLAAHAAQFATPPRVRLSQVFLSRELRGAAAATDARRLLKHLNATGTATAAGLGDGLPVPADLPPSSESDLARLFGPELAGEAAALPPGGWHGPLRSPYGLHLVRVHERIPGSTPSLDVVRAAVRGALLDERAEGALRAGVRTLRAQYAAEPTREAIR